VMNNAYANLRTDSAVAVAAKPSVATAQPATTAAIAPPSVPIAPAAAAPVNTAPIADRYNAASAPLSSPIPVGPIAPQAAAAPIVPLQINNPAAQPPMSATIGQAPAPAADVATNAGVAVPDPHKLPVGAPPLALDGYCPVTMR